MRAAVVRSFDRPPRYEEFDTPEPSRPGEEQVEVLAAGLHPRVRSGAAGAHYTSTGALPMIPGVDGVGRTLDGRLVYFVTGDDVRGSMADRAVVDGRVVPLPDDVDVVKIAATMNPAMSAWVALRRRVPFQPGQSVMVLGATGNAGGMAVQVAKRLGAARVVGVGRNPERLAALTGLGADDVVALDGGDATTEHLSTAAAEVDVVLDYLWGDPATVGMMAILTARADRSRSLDWVQIGAVAGATIELPSVALRSANLRIQGCGQGSVSTDVYLEELSSLVGEIATGTITVGTHPVPLADVESEWQRPDRPGVRTVFVP